MDEASQIAKAKEDSQEFAPLYEDNVDRVFRYLFTRVGDRALAEDLTSDTFIKAMKGLPSYKDEGKPFRAWLFRIAHNALVDHVRTQKPTEDIEDAHDLSSEDDPSQDSSNALAYAKIMELLSDFSDDEREILLLKISSGLTFREIAEMTGKSESTIKTTYFRRLRELKAKAATLILLILSIS